MKVQDNSVESAVVSHFWISSYPFFETVLFVIPPVGQSSASPENIQVPIEGAERTENSKAENSDLVSNPELVVGSANPIEDPYTSLIEIYDPDGEKINQLSFRSVDNRIQVIEVDRFLGACKLEAGFKHGHLVLSSPPGTGHFCRLHNNLSATFIGAAQRLNGLRVGFAPVTLCQDRSNLICCVNHGTEDSYVRCRLFCGKRNPEALILVPARGARVACLEFEFKEFSELNPHELVQAYVRFSTKPGSEIGVQIIERIIGNKDTETYSSIS